MTNYEIADQFSLLSKLMDIHGENAFKSKSYSIAAYNIEKLREDISGMDEAWLFSQKGIGESLGKKILEIKNTGRLDALEKMIAATPPGVLEMLEIKGLGPKKILAIWKEMGIESLGELEYACNENRLVGVKGFGAKTQQSVLESIVYYRSNQGFHLWSQVEVLANDLVEKLKKAFPDKQFALTGGLRRQLEVLEFMEIATDLDKDELIRQFTPIAGAVIREEADNTLIVKIPDYPLIKFHLSSGVPFPHTVFISTGSEDFLKDFFERYTLPDTPETEEDIFLHNKLSYMPAPLRETAISLRRPTGDSTKDLIQPESIRGIIHSHSTWSDGLDTIEVMAKTAIALGYEYIVISDHSQAAYYAQGLTPAQVAAQHQEIDVLNERLAPFRIFKSIEADILGDGSLDYDEQVLHTFDVVIASVHSNLKMSLEKAMDRVMAAIRNPFTTILGHPTGRLLLSREGYPLDHKKVIEACAEYNVVIEINAHPRRLDLDWRWIDYALERGVLLSIDPDAHSAAAFRDVYYGVMSAQKGGLTAQNNLSSFSLKAFEAFIGAKRSIK